MDPEIFVTLFSGQAVLSTDHGGAITKGESITLGPYSHVHNNFHGQLRLHRPDGREDHLCFIGGRVYYGGTLYADWMFFAGQPEKVTAYDPRSANPHRRRGDEEEEDDSLLAENGNGEE